MRHLILTDNPVAANINYKRDIKEMFPDLEMLVSRVESVNKAENNRNNEFSLSKYSETGSQLHSKFQ